MSRRTDDGCGDSPLNQITSQNVVGPRPLRGLIDSHIANDNTGVIRPEQASVVSVVGLADARHDERIQKESNAGGIPAAFDVVEDGVPDRIVDTRIRESTGLSGLTVPTFPVAPNARTRAVSIECNVIQFGEGRSM